MIGLRLEHVTKHFGGLKAVQDVTCEFRPGEIVGLIGPNGAGKTTLFNLITGVHRPTSGRIVAGERDIVGLPPHRIARLGIGRTFQQTRIFHHLRVFENVMLARPEVNGGVARALGTLPSVKRAWTRDAIDVLAGLDFADRAYEYGGDLSYAEQKLVMFACLVASGATMLLLDEPTAGLDPTSHRAMIGTVTRLRRPGTTIVLIEHNLDVVRGCSDRVIFLAEGRVITEGTSEEVERSAELRDLYFGSAGAA
jgi:ABC-type branched-subunit amino acid transport system ATPase component